MYTKFEIFDRIFIFKSYKIDVVKGIKSNCPNKKHVLFIDVDNVNLQWLLKRVRSMIEKFKLSNVYILSTSMHSFHVICLDKFTAGEIIDIQEWFDDELTHPYRIYGIKRKGWVLRTSKKFNKNRPEHIQTVFSRYSEREQSSAHAKILKEYYGIDVKLTNPDYNYNFIVDIYPTVKK